MFCNETLNKNFLIKLRISNKISRNFVIVSFWNGWPHINGHIVQKNCVYLNILQGHKKAVSFNATLSTCEQTIFWNSYSFRMAHSQNTFIFLAILTEMWTSLMLFWIKKKSWLFKEYSNSLGKFIILSLKIHHLCLKIQKKSLLNLHIQKKYLIFWKILF